MPSPFPGMDPYLEGSIWSSIHFSFSSEIVRQLAPKRLPRYLVLPNERLVMDTPEGVSVTTTDIYRDVGVLKKQQHTAGGESRAIIAAPLQLATVIPSPVPHVTIEIRDAAKRQLVTSIEVLSPTNKSAEGIGEYITKHQRVLLSTAHLLE